MLFGRRSTDPPAEAGPLAPDPVRIWGMEQDGRAQPARPVQDEQAEPAWLTAMHDAVYEMIEGEDLDDEAFDTLSLGHALLSGRRVEEVPPATFLATRSAAAVGYMSRQAEFERFAEARQPNGAASSPLRAALAASRETDGAEGVDLAAAAAWLARREAIDPGPDDEFRPSQLVAGMDPDRRHDLRETTLAIVVRPGPDGTLETPEGEVSDATLDDFRRTWKYGFFLRCLVEVVLEDSPAADSD